MNKELTKEECLEAIEKLFYIGCDSYYRELRDKIVELFEQLINEHFDNPPLKFEELEKGMPLWDYICDCWIYVVDIHKDFGDKRFTYVYWFDKNDDYYIAKYEEFEENRFYRYEVKE